MVRVTGQAAAQSRMETEPDLTLLSEIFEEIERNPPGIEARKLLINHYMATGWMDAAQESATTLSQLAPRDPEVKSLVATLRSIRKSAQRSRSPPPVYSTTSSPRKRDSEQYATRVHSTKLPDDKHLGKIELLQGYESLLERAKALLHETTQLRNLTQQIEKPSSGATSGFLSLFGSLFILDTKKESKVSARFEKHIPDLVAISDGRISSVVRAKQPGSVKSVARSMQSKPKEAGDIAFQDLEDMARWLSSPINASLELDNDGIRENLVTRVQSLANVVPEKMKPIVSTALMHIEHEVWRRKYISGDTTMLGDLVSDIPRENFYVTEDGYAWDIDELVQSIKSNGGVMRNPISKQMFTTDDIKAIVQHPLGKSLAAMEIEQNKLKLGVRPKTIEQLDKLQTVLLEDQTAESIPSRHAVDAFMAFLATLPQAEQSSLDKLRVPATDSHTGAKFDTSIGDAVRDAEANRICFHKAGDLIRQAVIYLRKR